MRKFALVVAAVLVAFVFAGGAIKVLTRAHAAGTEVPTSRFDPYLHRTSGEFADPVNLVFAGRDAETVARAIHDVLGWPRVDGSAMIFADQGAQRPTAMQFGLPQDQQARWHLRVEAVTKADGQEYVLAGVHRDDTVVCGHVGHEFDATRDVVAHAFALRGFTVTQLRLGNTQPGRQCDGSMSWGDGTAAVIDLQSQTLPATSPLFPADAGFLSPVYLRLR